MNLVGQLSVVSGSDLVARIPRLCYGPSSSQKIVYFANNGKDIINPSADVKKNDFMSKKSDAISDHFMEGYEERLFCYIENETKKKTNSSNLNKESSC